MSVASFEVVQESVSVLLETYTTGKLPHLELGLVMYLVLGCATALKAVCWAVCAALQSKSDSMLALAEVCRITPEGVVRFRLLGFEWLE